jgi:hypothetical protein
MYMLHPYYFQKATNKTIVTEPDKIFLEGVSAMHFDK